MISKARKQRRRWHQRILRCLDSCHNAIWHAWCDNCGGVAVLAQNYLFVSANLLDKHWNSKSTLIKDKLYCPLGESAVLIMAKACASSYILSVVQALRVFVEFDDNVFWYQTSFFCHRRHIFNIQTTCVYTTLSSFNNACSISLLVVASRTKNVQMSHSHTRCRYFYRPISQSHFR